MKRTTVWAIILCIPLTMGCQRLFNQEEITDPQQGFVPDDAPERAEFVATADGDYYNIQCLRGVAQAVAEEGRGAAEGCRMGNVANKTISRNVTEGRGFWNDWSWYGGYWNNWYLYPPTYYGGDNLFCRYIFGTDIDSDSFNCYVDFFQYDPYYSYGYGYDSKCWECLYRPNPQRCRERRGCWNYGGWDWYW